LEELSPDRLLVKSHYSAFCSTDLESWLRKQQCDTLVICGVQTHLCCETTAREAFMLDLAPVVVADACAAKDEELHLGALRNLAHGFSVIGTTDQLASALGASQLPESRLNSLSPPRKTELAVIGAGPAGLAAAIQAKRSGLDVTLLDPDPPGGQARTAECIENYPGFPGGIPGDQLMERFVAQARQLELKVHPMRTDAVELTGNSFVLTLEGQTHPLEAAAVIVATGSDPRGLSQLVGQRVVHRIDTLDRNLRGQCIVVVGGGEAALDQALYARRRGADRVTVVIRGPAPRAMDLLVSRAEKRGIQLLCETEVVTMPADGQIQLLRRGDSMTLPVDAVVVCIGKDSALPRLPGTLARSADGMPETDQLGRTSLPGLYLVGDVRRGRYRQVAIAVGDGVAASMHVADFLRSGIERD
jgi:thioredoxin reductase (NADPH)